MNTPDDASDDTINELWEQDGGAVEAGPLTRLFRGLGIDDKLPPIPSVQPIDVMPLQVGTPVSRATEAERICTCGIFEIAAGSTLCPRCTRIQTNRAVEALRHRQHTESVHREVTERRLTELDPEWRENFGDFKLAERYYWRELQTEVSGYGHPFQPAD